jgi:hypothetical protein
LFGQSNVCRIAQIFSSNHTHSEGAARQAIPLVLANQRKEDLLVVAGAVALDVVSKGGAKLGLVGLFDLHHVLLSARHNKTDQCVVVSASA